MINKFKKFWEELIAYFPLIRHDSIENKKIVGEGAHTTKRSHKPPNRNSARDTQRQQSHPISLFLFFSN
jgi:hypothetical protein